MSDIEKTTIQARLRAVWDGSSSYDMCHEAADEIDRLRAELASVGEEAGRLARQYEALSGIIQKMKELDRE